jgi:hypothetical protein
VLADARGGRRSFHRRFAALVEWLAAASAACLGTRDLDRPEWSRTFFPPFLGSATRSSRCCRSSSRRRRRDYGISALIVFVNAALVEPRDGVRRHKAS